MLLQAVSVSEPDKLCNGVVVGDKNLCNEICFYTYIVPDTYDKTTCFYLLVFLCFVLWAFFRTFAESKGTPWVSVGILRALRTRPPEEASEPDCPVLPVRAVFFPLVVVGVADGAFWSDPVG